MKTLRESISARSRLAALEGGELPSSEHQQLGVLALQPTRGVMRRRGATLRRQPARLRPLRILRAASKTQRASRTAPNPAHRTAPLVRAKKTRFARQSRAVQGVICGERNPRRDATSRLAPTGLSRSTNTAAMRS